MRAKAQASSQLSGLYRFLLKLVTPPTMGRFVSRTTQSYFDFGRVDVTGPSGGPLTIVRTGVPYVMVKWHSTASSAFLEAGIEAAVARRPRAKVTSVVVEGRDRQGLPLVTLHYELPWL